MLKSFCSTKKANSQRSLQTSILFADIAGFTRWSASKQPNEVFMLLETLYQAVSTKS